ncbi:rhodanese-related sulfurtransferase [Agreia sp. COWG]|uniref:oxygen-dependent tRNA uridine(34) hydroxylase TrhO n=1 Tax=Agreia sp. COWG TaxID=2773266 RepID=UPI0019280E2B|nr:rhodanese-related sulfurtransferase [Agreia sp. COWG]CAD5989535.1 conserved protein of unknown function [Agreia sp. COWG]
MAVSKVLLYYAFTPLADPDAIRLWQRDLCESLGLRGRILISTHGINGTVGGELSAVKKYLRKTRDYPAFKNLDAKWSEGSGLDSSQSYPQAPHGVSLDFPKLVVKVRDEIVSFGAPEELRVNEHGVVGGGTKLSPEQLHELVAHKGDDVVFFDGRNSFEAEIGKFAGAVVPDVSTTREFAALLDSGEYDHLKKKPVVTYCTGGIRCEVLSSLMTSRGFGEVYQLEGGIARYGEKFGDSGLWEGSLYVFDKRISLDFSADPKVLGTCVSCAFATKNMQNCGEVSCRKQLVVCEGCAASGAPMCADHAGIIAD